MNFNDGHGARSGARRLLAATVLALSLTLAGCIGGPSERAPRRAAHRPPPPPGGLSEAERRQCLADLGRSGVRFDILPDRHFGGGCSAIASVQLEDIGVPVSGLGAMTCPLADKFTAWARYGVQPAARLVLGSDLAKIETFGTYSCRNIIGNDSGKLSEHAKSNAVDVAAFVLADGRRISVRNDWTADSQASRFLHVVHDSACKRFRTVLSPDYNAAHRDHLHFDMGGRGIYCR